MDRFSAMRTFVTVVNRGSFASAAQAIGLSAPMVGNHIRYLEAHLGGLLLNRTTRRQTLTELGNVFYERCRTILAEFDAAEADARGLHAVPGGTLRVSAPYSVGTIMLPPVIATYLSRFPHVEIDLMLSDHRVDLLEDRFDVVIRSGELPDSGLIGRPLAPLRLVTCAAPAYLAGAGAPETLSDLQDHHCLDFTGSSTPGRWHFLRDSEIVDVPVHGRLRVNSGYAQRAAAIDGLGIALLPEMLVRQDLERGTLVQVLANETPHARPLHALMLRNRRPGAKIRSFFDFVVERLAD